jgi:outer membrane protein assembly factor BamB
MNATGPKQRRQLTAQSSGLWALVLVCSAWLTACSSEPKRPQPVDLGPNVVLQGARTAWSLRAGPLAAGVQLSVVGNNVVVAATDGTVLSLDAASGRENWRAAAGVPLATGAGSDGRLVAAASATSELLVWEAGRLLWRQRLTSQPYTAPLVAGDRVFVLGGDRSVTAFDGRTGQVLWSQQRTTEPLVLRQPGVLLAVGDTLVAGLSARLTGLNPDNGSIRWEAPLASPRGINDIERLVDLTAPVSRVADVVCARAYQVSVGCVSTARGSVLWTKPANGATGLAGDEQAVFAAEADGMVVAWRRSDGERLWSTDRLRYRQLTGALSLGRSVVVGDQQGLVHLLARENGAPLNRLVTDGSGIASTPVVAGNTLVVATRSGGIFGFVPE